MGCHVLSWAMVVLLVGVCRAGPAQGEQPPPPGNAALVIGFVADAEEPTLTFDRADAPPVGKRMESTPRGLYLLHPNGYVAGYNPVFDRGDEAADKREAEAGFELPVRKLENVLRIREPGTYRMYWENRKTGGRSNEVVLVRRERSPDARDDEAARIAKNPIITPVNAVRSFYRGMNGDANAMVAVIFAEEGDAAQKEARRLFWLLATEIHWLREMAKRRYGPIPGDIGWWFDYTDDEVAALDKATVTYTPYFDEASVKLPPGGRLTGGMRVVRRGTRWYVPASASLRKGKPNPELAQYIEAARRTSREINQGVHPTLRDAREAMRRRCEGKGEPPADGAPI